MVIHYETQDLAIDQLKNSNFRRLEDGLWISNDGAVIASIHPQAGTKVQIFYRAAK